MSSDLECEGHLSRADDSHDGNTTMAGLGHRHLEIEFSLLSDSDRKSYNVFLSQVHALVSAEALNLDPSVSSVPQAVVPFFPRQLIHDLPFRGPPSLPA